MLSFGDNYFLQLSDAIYSGLYISFKDKIDARFVNLQLFSRRMNLIIDLGNTFVKIAVIANNEFLVKESVKHRYANTRTEEIIKSHPKLKKAIIASVGKKNETLVNLIEKDLELLELTSDTKLPFKNKYSTPKTLGIDRMALVSASVEQFYKNNVLIIDAGTCITYDFINTKNHYLGGAISPGIGLRYQALHNLTANLPLLKAEYPVHITGDSTQESIHSGVIIGVLKEMDGVIDEYIEEYQDLTIILTGGDTLEGLNFILEYNSH